MIPVTLLLLLAVTAQNNDYEEDDLPYDTIHPPQSISADSVSISGAHRQRFTTFISSQSVNFTVLQCRNYKDFYRLLYTMCYKSVLCSERYSLEHPTQASGGSSNSVTTTAYETSLTRANFKKFVYRLSLRQLFFIHDKGDPPPFRTTTTTDNSSSDANQTTLPPLFLLEDKVPLEWIPRYVVQLTHTQGTACADTFDTLAPENVGFVHSTHYQLHLYSTYVRNDYECRHINEWLTLDAHNRPHCSCRQGKSCNNEGNYEIAIIVLTTFLIAILIINTISYFTNTKRVLTRLDQVNRTTSTTTTTTPVKTKQQ